MMKKGEMVRQKKWSCLSVDMATFIFGVISAVISGCGVIAFGTAKYWVGGLPGNEEYSMWLSEPESIRTSMASTDEHKKIMIFIQVTIYILYLFICCLISFIFSVFLCYGTKRRRPAFVKTYLVYGVVVSILLLARAVYYLSTGNILEWIIQVIICGVYFSILLVIKRTYEIIRAEHMTNYTNMVNPEACLKT